MSETVSGLVGVSDYQIDFVPWEDLRFGEVRDIRLNVVDEIIDNIDERGYNPAKAMRVVRIDGELTVADGNHRLRAIHELAARGEMESSTVPCVIEEEGDLFTISRESNQDDEASAPLDIFDYLDEIEHRRGQGLTQAEIGEEMGWSRKQVADHCRLLDKVVPEVLETARENQTGRGTGSVPNGTNVPTHTFGFTEGWFRTIGKDGSSLYALSDASYFQQWFMAWFVHEERCDVGKQKIGRKIDELCNIKSQIDILDEELNEGVDTHKATELESAVLSGEYTEDSLRDAIEAANLGAKDQAYFGADSVEKLQEFEENKIACVVTDPPWGVDHTTHRPNELPDFDGGLSDTMTLWAEVCNELTRVCKANAHLYVFFSTQHYTEVRGVLEKFFEVDPVPIQWVKNNHAPTRDTDGFKKRHVYQYESAFFCRMPNGESRELNKKVSPNVLEHAVPKGDDRWHSTQKPISLFEELLTNSTGAGETIMDPFAGSGSALLAAKRSGRHYIGIEKSEDYESRFKKELRKIEDEDGGASDE